MKKIMFMIFFLMILLFSISINSQAFYTSRITTNKNSYYTGESVEVSYEIDCGYTSTVDNVRVFAQYGSSTDYAYNDHITLSYITGETWGKSFSFILSKTGEIEIVAIALDNGEAVAEAIKTISVDTKTYSVNIYVKDKAGNPIQDAKVSFSSKYKSTDSLGEASFNLEYGKYYDLTISKNNYNTLSYDNIEFNGDKTLQYTLTEFKESNNQEEDVSTSGFEFIIFILVISLVILIRRNKRH